MLAPSSFHQQISTPNHLQSNQKFNLNRPIWRRTQKSVVVQCSREKVGGSKNYYKLLGVSIDASPQEIKNAYRNLQKRYHPDIAGEEGHEKTVMLNEAYKVLIRDRLRREYDGRISGGVGRDGYGSLWKGPLRPQSLFVDENACIGCRECVHQASNTFVMDEALGTAHVKVQYGDDDGKIEISVDSCPVNCIHWVNTEQLPVLEYLIQLRPKMGYGIYGQGWERPADVFMAAESYSKQLKQQEENQQKYARSSDEEEETPAQAQARESAYRELKMGSFARIWSWIKKNTGQ